MLRADERASFSFVDDPNFGGLGGGRLLLPRVPVIPGHVFSQPYVSKWAHTQHAAAGYRVDNFKWSLGV